MGRVAIITPCARAESGVKRKKSYHLVLSSFPFHVTPKTKKGAAGIDEAGAEEKAGEHTGTCARKLSLTWSTKRILNKWDSVFPLKIRIGVIKWDLQITVFISGFCVWWL